MSKVIIFGCLDTAQLANYYLTIDSGHEVVAFTVHQKYMTQAIFEGKLVCPFEELTKHYPPSEFKLFAPMTGAGMNTKRKAIYEVGKQMGYSFISYISSKATKFNNKIGENCFILENNVLQPYTNIGNNVVMWSGNHIGHHSEIGDHTFFTSHVVLSGHCRVDPYSWFGVNSTIKNDTHIAEGTLVGMGSVITKDTEPYGVYIGIPGKKQSKTSLEANP